MKYKCTIVDTREDGVVFKKIKLPEEISLVEVMPYDMEAFCKPIFIDAIKEVLSGKVDSKQYGGNIVDLQIGRDLTTVCNLFARDGVLEECTIETEELHKIIQLWVDTNKELLNDGC